MEIKRSQLRKENWYAAFVLSSVTTEAIAKRHLSYLGGEVEIGSRCSLPPKSVLLLPFCTQIQGMALGQRNGWLARLSHSQATQALPALGAHLYWHAGRSSL